MMAGHIAIPIFSAEGELLAYAGRDTGTSEVVYKYPDNFRRELELYNLHRALASGRFENDGLVIVPDFFDVIRLYEAGIPHVVALMSDDISKEQEEALRGLRSPSQKLQFFVGARDRVAGFALLCRLSGLSVVLSNVALVVAPDDIGNLSTEEIGELLS